MNVHLPLCMSSATICISPQSAACIKLRLVANETPLLFFLSNGRDVSIPLCVKVRRVHLYVREIMRKSKSVGYALVNMHDIFSFH